MAEMNARQGLEADIERFEREAARHGYQFRLADLVMMQMAGNFTAFLAHVAASQEPDRAARAAGMIEQTRQAVTSEKLFPSIVKKAIEAQFGNKHAAVRELGQNAIDAYEPGDTGRTVAFTTREEGGGITLAARDRGCGMDLAGMVRDLLIPYNSGKEFDLTKIGEHGIGWYSVVDLAQAVKVASRQRREDGSTGPNVQALVRQQDGDWQVALIPGGTDEPAGDAGTEVTAYIPAGKTTRDELRNFLFQYLGMVDPLQARITLDGEPVNAVRGEYATAEPVPIRIDGEQRSLSMGVSKRAIHGNLNDSRFTLRNQQLSKILQTQRGLYINSVSPPFHAESIQGKLLADLMELGLDFWVEVPEHVGLTKGRNSVIADHDPAVADATYKAFENTYLDVILNDEQLIYHPSGALLESIAELFNKDYASRAQNVERARYSLKRKLLSRAAAFGSGLADYAVLCGRYLASGAGGVAKGLGKAVAYPFTTLPRHLEELVQYAHVQAPAWKADAARSLRKWVPIGGLAGGAVHEGIQLHNAYGWRGLAAVGLATATAGLGYGSYRLGKYAARKWPDVRECWGDFWQGIAEYLARKFAPRPPRQRPLPLQPAPQPQRPAGPSLWDRIRGIGSGLAEIVGDCYQGIKDKFSGGWMGLLNKCGLYVDVEQKRERKREKQRRKISQKYLSVIQKNEFLGKILAKKIIPATRYYSPDAEQEERDAAERGGSIGDLLAGIMTGDGGQYEPVRRAHRQWGRTQGPLEKEHVKLSIDELVHIHLRRKLRHAATPLADTAFSHGEYFVDYNNPVVRTVVDRMQEISHLVGSSYDVSVLEDHLDNIWGFTKGVAKFIYFVSPLGWLHLLASGATSGAVQNPFEGFSPYTASKSYWQDCKKWWKEHDPAGVALRGAGTAARGTVTLLQYALHGVSRAPVGVPRFLGRTAYEHLLAPAGRALDPRRYPNYLAHLADRIGAGIRGAGQLPRLPWKLATALTGLGARAALGTKDCIAEIINTYRQRRALRAGAQASTSFDNLGLDRLAHVTDSIGAGRAYVDFLRMADGLDKLVAEALGARSHRIVLTANHYPNTQAHEGLVHDPQERTLHIDLAGADETVPVVQYQGATEDQAILARKSHLILDALLHCYAEGAVGEFWHRRDRQDGRGPAEHHTQEFHKKKDEFRRKVITSLDERKLSLTEYASQFLTPVYGLPDPLYHINAIELAKAASASRKVLHDLREYYDARRVELLKKQAPRNPWIEEYGGDII